MQLFIHTDGGSRGNPGPAGIGIYVKDDHDVTVYEEKRAIGPATNNVAEYTALLLASAWVEQFCQSNQVEKITFLLDSKLVVEQILGNWKMKQAHLAPLHSQILKHLNPLDVSWQIQYIPREQNSAADALVNQALDEEKFNNN